MTTAAEILTIARSQLKVVEGPRPNEVIYNTWYYGKVVYGPQYAWCDTFVCWVFDQAGALDLIGGKHAYTPTHAEWFQDNGLWGQEPRIGALPFFIWPGLGRIGHIEITEGVRPDSVVNIGGNTDAAGGRTGGKVMRKVRRANIAGYGYPKYAPSAPPVARVDRLLGIANPPMKGQDVLNVQRALNRLGNHLPETGVYDRKTADLIALFQRNRKINERGVGPLTWAALRKGPR